MSTHLVEFFDSSDLVWSRWWCLEEDIVCDERRNIRISIAALWWRCLRQKNSPSNFDQFAFYDEICRSEIILIYPLRTMHHNYNKKLPTLTRGFCARSLQTSQIAQTALRLYMVHRSKLARKKTSSSRISLDLTSIKPITINKIKLNTATIFNMLSQKSIPSAINIITDITPIPLFSPRLNINWKMSDLPPTRYMFAAMLPDSKWIPSIH